MVRWFYRLEWKCSKGHMTIDSGVCLAEKIEMPEHKSKVKKLVSGRLLFYVTFLDGYTQIDLTNLMKVLGFEVSR